MKGLLSLLAALGVRIDPAEIELGFNKAKDALPKLANDFEALRRAQERIERIINENHKDMMEALNYRRNAEAIKQLTTNGDENDA